MDKKICLDTDICIEILKNTDKGIHFLNFIEDKEVFITTISVFELFLRERNFYPIEKLLFQTSVLDFSELCARRAAEINKDQKKRGNVIELRDLFIASIAIVNNCTLATFNKKHFSNILNLDLLDF